MAPFAILFLSILIVTIPQAQAEPLVQVQPSANEDCIQMSDDKVNEIKQIIQELTDFIDTLTIKHEYFDLKLIKLDIEKYFESNNDTQTILELFVNDCGKRSESYNLSGEFVADHTKYFANDDEDQANSHLNSNINSYGATTKSNFKNSKYQVVTKKESPNSESSTDQTTVVNVIRKKKASGNLQKYNINSKQVDKSSGISSFNNNKHDHSFEHFDDTSNFNQEVTKNGETDTSVTKNSTPNISNNQYVMTTTSAEDNVSDQSTDTFENYEDIYENSESVVSENNFQDTRNGENNQGHLNKKSQSKNNKANKDQTVQSTSNNANTEKNSQYLRNVKQVSQSTDASQALEDTNNNDYGKQISESTENMQKKSQPINNNGQVDQHSQPGNKDKVDSDAVTQTQNNLNTDNMTQSSQSVNKVSQHKDNNANPDKIKQSSQNAKEVLQYTDSKSNGSNITQAQKNNANREKIIRSSQNAEKVSQYRDDLNTDEITQAQNKNINTDNISHITVKDMNTDDISQSTNDVEKRTQSKNNDVNTNKLSQSTKNADKFSYDTNDDTHSDKSSQSTTEINYYRDKTSKNKVSCDSKTENVDGKYNTEIDKYGYEENQFLKYLKELIRREVIAAEEDKNHRIHYAETETESIDYELNQNAITPTLVKIILPDDVLEVKNRIDRGRGIKPSHNPMLVYLKQCRGQQIMIF